MNNFSTMPLRFRVWDKEGKCFVPSNYDWGFAIRIDGGVSHHDGVINYGWKDRFIISQDTGLKDKNGKSIYTGDIVEKRYSDDSIFNGVRATCCYRDGAVDFDCMIGNDNVEGFLEEYKIVGDIWQNPDLLEEK